MKRIKIWDNGISSKSVEEITDVLKSGGVIIWPTDTLYGIACDAMNTKAIERVCRMKGLNPDKNTLSLVCSGISQASEYARIENAAFSLMKEHTPGPVTFVLRAASKLPKAFKGRKTVGIRIPDREICRAVAESLGNPLLNTSVDFEDEDYAVSSGLIAEAYEGKADLFIDGGDGGIKPSTVIDCTSGGFEILRP